MAIPLNLFTLLLLWLLILSELVPVGTRLLTLVGSASCVCLHMNLPDVTISVLPRQRLVFTLWFCLFLAVPALLYPARPQH